MFLRQSSTFTDRIGPFLDATDGVTEEVGLTTAASAIFLSPAGGNFVAKNESTALSHDQDGWYVILYDATDTATVGKLEVMVQAPATHLPVWKTYWVLEENVYDMIYVAGADLGTTIDAILTDTGTTLDNAVSDVHSRLVVIDAEETVISDQIALVLTDTGTTLENQIASILVDTGTQIPSQITIVRSDTSDVLSALLDATIGLNALETITSDTHSLLTLVEVIASDAESNVVVVAANVLLALSDTSDTLSILNDATIGLNALETIVSDTESNVVVVAANVLITQSEVSQILSDTTVIESDVILALSDTSDILSALVDATIGLNALETIVSDTESNLVVVASQVLLTQSEVSNILSDTLVLESSVSQILSDTTRLELGLIVATGTVSGTPTTTVLATSLSTTQDDKYNDMIFMMISGGEAGESRRILDFATSTETITLDVALSGSPTSGESFVIINSVESGGALSATQASELTRCQSDAIRIHSDTIQILSDTTRLELSHVIVTGTVENSGSNSTTQVQTTLSEATDNHYNNNVTILFTNGAEAGQARVIDDYDGALGVVSWTEALTGTPADSVTFSLIPSGSVIATLATGAIKASTYAAGARDAAGLAADAATEIGAAVWDAVRASHDTAGSFGAGVSDLLSDTAVVEQVTSDIESNLSDIHLLLDTEMSDTLSRLILVQSDVSNILSDTLVLESSVSQILSDTTVIDTNLNTVDDLIDTEIGDIQNRLPAALVSGRMSADMVAISGSTTVADLIELSGGQIIVLTVDTGAFSPTTTEFEADDVTEATADHFIGRNIYWTTGVLAGQATDITDYALVGANGHFTVTALTESPGNNDTGVIV